MKTYKIKITYGANRIYTIRAKDEASAKEKAESIFDSDYDQNSDDFHETHIAIIK